MALFLLLFAALTASADHPVKVWRCETTAKHWPGKTLSPEELKSLRERSELDLTDPKKSVYRRCSYAPSQKRVTCDEYAVDRLENYAQAGGILKAYLFGSQSDLQIFVSSKTALENNGRGGVAYQSCGDSK